MSFLWQWLFGKTIPPPKFVPIVASRGPLTRYKAVILGDSGVGKTCIVNMITNKTFKTYYRSTIGIDFLNVKIPVNKHLISDDKPYYNLEAMIWDTAGPERFQAYRVTFYRGLDALIVTYDINNEQSMNHVESWIQEFKRQTNTEAIIMIVGNKTNLPRKVEFNSGLKIAKKHNALFFALLNKCEEKSMRNTANKYKKSRYIGY
jgi:small GTP-binding protein